MHARTRYHCQTRWRRILRRSGIASFHELVLSTVVLELPRADTPEKRIPSSLLRPHKIRKFIVTVSANLFPLTTIPREFSSLPLCQRVRSPQDDHALVLHCLDSRPWSYPPTMISRGRRCSTRATTTEQQRFPRRHTIVSRITRDSTILHTERKSARAKQHEKGRGGFHENSSRSFEASSSVRASHLAESESPGRPCNDAQVHAGQEPLLASPARSGLSLSTFYHHHRHTLLGIATTTVGTGVATTVECLSTFSFAAVRLPRLSRHPSRPTRRQLLASPRPSYPSLTPRPASPRLTLPRHSPSFFFHLLQRLRPSSFVDHSVSLLYSSSQVERLLSISTRAHSHTEQGPRLSAPL